MAFVNFDNKQDMQDDTYKIVATRLDQIFTAIILNDVVMAYKIEEALFLLIGGRCKDDEKGIEDEIKKISNLLYGHNATLNDKTKSVALDACKKVFGRISRSLDNAGILLRMEEKREEMFKRGSHG